MNNFDSFLSLPVKKYLKLLFRFKHNLENTDFVLAVSFAD